MAPSQRSPMRVLCLALTAIALLAAGCSSDTGDNTASAGDGDQMNVRLGLLKSSMITALHGVAESHGTYEDHGLNVEVVGYESGQGSIQAQALLAGDIDVFYGSGIDIVSLDGASMAEGDEPQLSIIAAATPGILSLVLRDDVSFSSVDDLAGLKIGVSSPGSFYIPIFEHYLFEQGTSVQELGIEYVTVDSGNMPSALVTRQIDGFLHSEPTSSIAINEADGQRALAGSDFGEQAANISVTTLAAPNDWLDDNPEVAKALVGALNDASELYESMSKEEKTQALTDYVPVEPEIVDQVVDILDPTLVPLESAADAFWTISAPALKRQGAIPENMEADDVFDPTFNDEVGVSE